MRLNNASDWWSLWSIIEPDVKDYIFPVRIDKILSHPRTPETFGEEGMAVLKEFQESNPTIYEVWDILTLTRDKRLYFLLHSVWDEAPDSPVIHSWPNWGNFCDLLSEGPECLELCDK